MSNGYYQLATGVVVAIEGDCPFPPLSQALTNPNGLVAIGGDLTPNRLLAAYRAGIFPWFSEDEPILWWSPNPRMVLFPEELNISRSLKKTINKAPFELRINHDFRSVITACSHTKRAGQSGTWITEDMIEAYCTLNQQGYAISAESWQNNVLVGGCYGIKIGHMFYGESMFHHVPEASKVAFVHLVTQLKQAQVGMIDCQMKTPLLTSFGGREIERSVFIEKLKCLII
jgi:leucyl/phenylalanyl-tRNA---protein transferase